jgi:putative transposase
MRKSRFTEAQIIGMIKEQKAGIPMSEAPRLKALEDENAKLKRLLADTMLDNVVLKDLLGKN